MTLVEAVEAELARLGVVGTPLAVLASQVAEDLDAGARSAGLVREMRMLLLALSGRGGDLLDEQLAGIFSGASLGD